MNYNKLLRGYLISSEEKEKIEEYISKVSVQNEKYKDINNLKNILDLGHDNMQKLDNIEVDNKALKIKVKALENKVKEKDTKIKEFNKLINFVAKRLTNPKTKEKYREFVGDLLSHGIFSYTDSAEINNAVKHINEENEKVTKQFYSDNLDKEKDDYEL